MFERLNQKQNDFILDVIDNETSRLNLLVGSVRSGKTYVSLIAWLIMVSEYPTNSQLLMVGKTITSLKRNCLSILESLLPKCAFSFSTSKKEASIFGRKIYLEGVNDSRAEQKIRGMTLQAAYCDELTLFNEEFFAMLLSRLSMPNAKLLATTNPGHPGHWLKTKYIDRRKKEEIKEVLDNKKEVDLKLWEFLIDDNTTLAKDYIDNIKREYTGVFYDRFILGKWVQAEGLIYHLFADNPHKYIYKILPEQLAFVSIGIDYGASKSKTAFIATGFSLQCRNVYILEEYSMEGIKDPEQIYDSFIDFYKKIQKEYGTPRMVYADYGALGQVITRGLQNKCAASGIKTYIRDCKKGTINDRIQLTSQLFAQGRLFINDKCKNMIEAFSSAVWQENKIDVRLDDGTVPIDFLDAFEYSIYDFELKLTAIHNYIC